MISWPERSSTPGHASGRGGALRALPARKLTKACRFVAAVGLVLLSLPQLRHPVPAEYAVDRSSDVIKRSYKCHSNMRSLLRHLGRLRSIAAGSMRAAFPINPIRNHDMQKASIIKAVLTAGCVALFALSAPVSADVKLNGSGASFPFPIYSKWFKDFSKEHKDIRVDYQSKGSGAGIQDLINGTVDFAASDAAMEDAEIAKVKQGVVLLPMTAGEIVLIYNLKGVKDLKLSRAAYAGIFSGTITKWNDPAIAATNPGVALPDKAITVVTRSDSSGTSYVFSGHLAAISEAFDKAVGKSKQPNWPSSGKFVAAPKNDGVTAQVQQNEGAIGYVEYGYAKLTGWKQVAQLENKSGNFVAAGPQTGAAALAASEFPGTTLPNSDVPNLIAWNWDPVGAESYPIVSYTWMLFYKDQDDAKAAALRKMVKYGIEEGQKIADSMGYIPLPENVQQKVLEAAEFIQ
ncbi:phosphate ABC transporter substrate-binding protein PstS [Lamprocystis purpurea]|uniref:phosphate ABC transporter substrate-binding protein PstS n=1 Tax=Lamprocystis purpurea TaxID=61598 RepID=UPI001FDF9F67|nr:phosphate ABC transporter substrate-binding protein PstS [Lamprocystis purpurea]